jgi:hypothetical protein
MPFFNSMAELPATYSCRKCGQEKPTIPDMIVVRRRRDGKVMLRPRCKQCHNARERGHRREYKLAYLRRWRKRNAELNESYWRKESALHRERLNATARERFRRDHDAVLIQGRLRRQLGMRVPLAEARELASKYGPCYPTRLGLTPWGLREYERIRASLRRMHKEMKPIEVRTMLYADGHFITPRCQKTPYRAAAKKMRRWQAERRQARKAAA